MAGREDVETSSPIDQVRAVYEEVESQTARAFERAVATPSFGLLLAYAGENVAALTRIGSDTADLVLRNLRLAGRADIVRLARQLHRTEDKLERVLQEVEDLRDEMTRREQAERRREQAERRRGQAGDEPETLEQAAHSDQPTAEPGPHANGHDREGRRRASTAR
jgi:hypothetical protein